MPSVFGSPQRIVRSNEAYFRMCVGLLLVLFAGSCFFVYNRSVIPSTFQPCSRAPASR